MKMRMSYFWYLKELSIDFRDNKSIEINEGEMLIVPKELNKA